MVKETDKKLNEMINKCKKDYKNKLENNFNSNNSRAAWQSMYTILGKTSKQTLHIPNNEDPTGYTNKLNTFYARFDKHDFSHEIAQSKLDTIVRSTEKKQQSFLRITFLFMENYS